MINIKQNYKIFIEIDTKSSDYYKNYIIDINYLVAN